MTDEKPVPDERPAMTPEQAREVRRLLADARHTEPMPTDVAARLDRVLGELATHHDAPAADGAPATVTALASRRRRRFTSLLVAAAAVVAVGVGVDQLTHGLGASSSSDSAASGVAEDNSVGSRSRGPSGDVPQLRDGEELQNLPMAGAVAIRPDHFAEDAERARRVVRAATDSSQAYGVPGKARTCTAGDWGKGTVVPVRYDGHPAALVFRKVRGDTRVVDLYRCGSSTVTRSITLNAR